MSDPLAMACAVDPLHSEESSEESKSKSKIKDEEKGESEGIDLNTIRMLAAILSYLPFPLLGVIFLILGKYLEEYKDTFTATNGLQGVVLGCTMICPFFFIPIIWVLMLVFAIIPILGWIITFILFWVFIIGWIICVINFIVHFVLLIFCIVFNVKACGNEETPYPWILPIPVFRNKIISYGTVD